MKTKHSVWKNKLAKTMFLMTVVLVAALFLGSAASAGLRSQETKTENNIPITALDKDYPVRADGLSPLATKATPNQHEPVFGRGYYYAYNAYDPTGAHPVGPVTFDDPGAIDSLGSGPSFIAGADIDDEENWYGVNYYGGIYKIEFDGTMVLMGSSIQMNGLTYDSSTQTWYGSGGNNLYTVDVTTGATTLIGAHGTTNTIIGLAADKDGNIYAYDVLFTGTSTLFSINKDTGAATTIGSMGIGFLYAQDPAYDRDNDILYLAGYTQSGTSGLYICDTSSGAVTLQGGFEGGMEVTGFGIPWMPFQYDNDISISGIVAPASGTGAPITPVVKVKNAGLNTLYNVPVELEIGKELVTGEEDDFEEDNGGYTEVIMTNGAWQWGTPTSGPMAAHSGSKLWATNLAGNYPAYMWTRLITPEMEVPPNGQLTFWHWYYLETNYDGGSVKLSTDGGSTWTLITPVGGYPGAMNYNPYLPGQACYNGNSGGWKKATFDLSSYDGQMVKLMFEAASDSSVQYAGWYIDDVGFTAISWVEEYLPQTVIIPVIYPDETLDVSFPLWTPSDLGFEENKDINYFAEATNLYEDDNPNNDYKSKAFTLHYGWFYDLKVKSIPSPVSGLASPQVPEVEIESVGQFDASANVNMVISKKVYGDQWTQESPTEWAQSNTNQAGGVAPEAWLPYYNIVGDYAYLRSTPIDTSEYEELTVSFRSMINNYAGGYNCYVKVRASEADPWTDISPWTNPITATIPAALYTIDITDHISTATQVMFEFDGYYWNLNYWYLDDFTCDGYYTDFSGVFPPMSVDLIEEYDQTVVVDIAAGETLTVALPLWTPEDFPVFSTIDYQAEATVTVNGLNEIYCYGFEDYVPPSGPMWPFEWTQEQEGEWQSYNYPPSGWVAPCAYLPYYAISGDYAWFKSPAVDTTGQGPVSLSFKSYVNNYAGGYNCYVMVTTNGVDWTDVSPWTNPISASQGPATYTINIDEGANTQVMFVFDGYYWNLNYWYIDDVEIGSTLWDFYPEVIPGYLPGWSQYAFGTDPDNLWTIVTSGSYPTTMPHSGTYMAQYGCFYISSGNSNLFVKDDPFDFTETDGYALKIWMNHDTGYSGAADQVWICASDDGENFYGMDILYRYDGSTGWKQHSVDLSAFAGLPEVWIALYGVSYYGNNIFMDDLCLYELGVVDDGNPADNTMIKSFTLSYEHDVGVIAITEPSGTPAKADGWLQYDNGVYSNAFGSTTGEIYGANRFTIDELGGYVGWQLDMIRWKHYDAVSVSGDIQVYDAGSSSAPGALLATVPFSVTGADWFDIELDTPITITGTDIWLCVHAFHATGEYPIEASAPGISYKSAFFSSDGSTWYDLPGLGYDVAWMIRGHVAEGGGGGDEYWLPGIYPVEGIIQNFGVTFTEYDIPVNAKITNDTGVVVYDETVIVPGPLAPGQTTAVAFPDIDIPWDPDAEGDYKLTMETQLPDDDHPANNKKTLSFVIMIPDTEPPVTTATVTGTMGQNDWYVSSVTVTLEAEDFKWPQGVDYTMYKVDDGDWEVYEVPIVVSTDGEHTVYFYSVDKADPPNVEETKDVSFKMDKTAPVFTEYTFTPLNALKNKWLCAAVVSDATSGIVLVEFYVDDALVGSVTTTPYEFEFNGKPTSGSQAIAYDAAGNSALSPIASYVEYQMYSQTLLLKLL